ncbi:hypothetical protein NC653_025957 [Populus alba x Populus x berolinensis]|uniref:Uncharacterized protein n=1 Tax=Populus alba x Populus x berolinensis TaxID=444605 RepID=A0AAD6MDC7_9ROSI|nr:hypothetical protein NC653_025957 [Populus alba x Populus x berolinensis]
MMPILTVPPPDSLSNPWVLSTCQSSPSSSDMMASRTTASPLRSQPLHKAGVHLPFTAHSSLDRCLLLLALLPSTLFTEKQRPARRIGSSVA